MLTISSPRPWCHHPPHAYLSIWIFVWVVAQLSLWNCKSFNAYKYIHTGNDLISVHVHMVCSTTIQHGHGHGSSIMGNIASRAGIERAVWMLTSTPPMFHDVTILPTPTRLWGSLPARLLQTTTNTTTSGRTNGRHPSSCVLVNHGPSQKSSKEVYKPCKWNTTHLIQRLCYQQESTCQNPTGSWITFKEEQFF